MPAAALAAVAVISAAGSIYSGIQASNNADYNEKVANQSAQAAQDKAKYDENIHRERVRSLLSQQRALWGKSGVAMEGTPLLSLEDTAGQGELDALAIRYGGDVDAAKQRSAGALAKMQGKSTAISSYMQAGSSLLSGGSKAYTAYKTP